MKTKITYVVHGLNVGGLEKQLLQHVRALLKFNKYDITIVTISKTSETHNLYKEVPEGVVVQKMHFRHVYSVGSYVELYKLLKQIDPDVVISSQFLANTAVRFCRFFYRFKVIAREHNIHPEWTIFHKLINAFLFRFSNDVYLAVSKEAAAAAARASFLSVDKVQVIENGIDQLGWSKIIENLPEREMILNEFNLPSGKKFLLCVARLTDKKRIDRLLLAFKDFSKSSDRYELLIVGDGTEADVLKQQMNDLGLSKSVHFMGTQKQIGKFYKIADIFVLSSDHEGFPNVALEALLFKLPLVSTPVPGIAAVIVNEDIGYITEPNPASFAEKLSVVSQRTDMQKKQQIMAAEKHVKNLSVDAAVAKYIELFEYLYKENRI